MRGEVDRPRRRRIGTPTRLPTRREVSSYPPKTKARCRPADVPISWAPRPAGPRRDRQLEDGAGVGGDVQQQDRVGPRCHPVDGASPPVGAQQQEVAGSGLPAPPAASRSDPAGDGPVRQCQTVQRARPEPARRDRAGPRPAAAGPALAETRGDRGPSAAATGTSLLCGTSTAAASAPASAADAANDRSASTHRASPPISAGTPRRAA